MRVLIWAASYQRCKNGTMQWLPCLVLGINKASTGFSSLKKIITSMMGAPCNTLFIWCLEYLADWQILSLVFVATFILNINLHFFDHLTFRFNLLSVVYCNRMVKIESLLNGSG